MLAISLLMWFVLFGFPSYGYRRGSSTIFFSTLLVGVAGFLAHYFGTTMSGWVVLTDPGHVQANEGLWRLILFILLLIPCFPLGIYFSRLSVWSFDPFDNSIGLFIGIGTGLLTAWILAKMLTQAYDGLEGKAQLEQLFVIRQFGYYEWWHVVNTWMINSPNPEVHRPQ